jgi:ascorbate PTS system EIIA or EIIAB component
VDVVSDASSLDTNAVIAAVAQRTVEDWRAGVRLACSLLEEQDAVTPQYAERCIAAVEDEGPYVVLAPGIALAHARPEDGVERLGVSVATLTEPVMFGHPDNDPVDVVFAFGSPDEQQHVGLLSELATQLLGGLADRLRQAGDDQAAQALLQEIASDG